MNILIRATNLWGYDELVRSKGADPLPFLEKYSIPAAKDRSDQDFISHGAVLALIEETAQSMRFPVFGLELAKYQGLEILGPISVIARSSSTIAEAFNNISRYLYLHCPALKLTIDFKSKVAQGLAILKFEINDDSVKYKVQSYELSLANGMQMLKLLGGESLHPHKVCFMHPRQGDLSIYRDTFGCEVLFEHDWCGAYVSLASFGKGLTSADYQTWQLAERYLSSRLVPDPSSLISTVSELIRSLLPTNQCSGEIIANHLSMHRRTLQRRLSMEGVTYEQLLSKERKSLTERYLVQKDMRFDHIAGLLGYSEQSVFNRACKKWFSMTPSEYRQKSNMAVNK